jgi:replicative DNA helicase Mcm
MREFQTNEDGDMDVDTVESGTSKTQKERIEYVRELILELQGDDPLAMGQLITAAEDELGLSKQKTKRTVENMCERGEAYHPDGEGTIRVFNR